MPVVLRAILGVSLRLLLLLIVVGLWLNTLRIKLHTRARRNRAESKTR